GKTVGCCHTKSTCQSARWWLEILTGLGLRPRLLLLYKALGVFWGFLGFFCGFFVLFCFCWFFVLFFFFYNLKTHRELVTLMIYKLSEFLQYATFTEVYYMVIKFSLSSNFKYMCIHGINACKMTDHLLMRMLECRLLSFKLPGSKSTYTPVRVGAGHFTDSSIMDRLLTNFHYSVHLCASFCGDKKPLCSILSLKSSCGPYRHLELQSSSSYYLRKCYVRYNLSECLLLPHQPGTQNPTGTACTWGTEIPAMQRDSCREILQTAYFCATSGEAQKAEHQSESRNLPGALPFAPGRKQAVGVYHLLLQPASFPSSWNYWNAASFVTSSSYLHFSTFQGETSADISFYFKTSASDGVFLENLGNTDFIKLELKSATEVSFSFDVGNGPVEIVVRSPNPLNDDQWHRVNAERNVKQASLQVDQLPLEVRKAPTEGHTRLELYSQLYVGAAGGQRGFLGCIRSLRMNGVTLDLEERAKVTPGVKPGCSGHCTSYGMYCANGGKCVEKYNGYSCDCSRTAYDGPFCIKDVGAFFEEGMWLRYNFHSPGTSVKDLVSRTLLSSADPEITAPDLSLNKEELSFSFSTTKSPCVLLYVSSYTPDFMAVLVNPNGNLQIRYNLGGTKEPYNIDIDHRNMANGQPHTVNVTRNGRDIVLQLDHYPPTSYSLPATSDIQFNSPKALFLGKVIEIGKIDQDIYKYNTPGFTGCLSRVQFNQIAPLKAALRPTNASSHVHIQGELVESNCGASPLTIPPMSAATDPWHLDSGKVASADFPYNGQAIGDGVNRNSAIIGGVIAVVIFTILCTLVFLIRYMFRHKGTYHTNEAKGAESAESADAAIMNNDPNFTETIDESKKEWLI
ncbi:CNTP2 protein, partial [Zosterops hypoxanthus]|nr:CNTP2 protein [Zosterops hypoxanthus]